MKKIIILIVLILVVVSTHSKPSQSSYFDIAEQRIEKYNPKRKDLVIIVDYRKNI
jgi:hypothetical protein